MIILSRRKIRTKNMKKIAFLISSLNTGGAQRAVSNIVLNMPREWAIDIILNDNENIVYPYRGNIVSLGVKEPKDRNALIYQCRVFIKRIIYLRKIKKKGEYQAVISFLHSANTANILTGNKHCKTIISVRSRLSAYESLKYKLFVHTVVKMLYNQADSIVALSEGVRQDLIDNFGLSQYKITTIYNCYNLSDIQKKGSMNCNVSGIGEDDFNVVAMGRLIEGKGHRHLIRAFSEIAKMINNAKLYLLGDGEEKKYLIKLAKDLGIQEKVIFTGFEKNPFSILNKMDVYVFPSLYEGFGNALVEAMACGLPCITSDFRYGAREIMQRFPEIMKECSNIEYSDYGILVPICSGKKYTAKDPLEHQERCMAQAIIELYQDDELRNKYKELSLERAKCFSPKFIIGQWSELISQ